MKKLMCFAAALTAGIALADISSSNVVGYQDMPLESGYNFIMSSFAPISESIMLKDIRPKGIAYLGDMIQLLDDQGACMRTAEYEDLGEVYLQLTYATVDDGAPADGWYIMEDWGFAHPQNDRVIPYGQAFCIEGLGAGESITFAGQVAAEDTEIQLAAGFNFTGNCSPVSIKYKDIAINGITYLGDMIQILDDQGACKRTAEYEDLGEVYLQLTYATVDDGAPANGWYIMEDWGFAHPQGELDLPAGQAFCIEGLGAGESITIPSAL